MGDVFANSYKGRETGHPSRLAYDETIPHNEPYWKFISRYRRATNFLFDYELQRETYFSGLPGLWVTTMGEVARHIAGLGLTSRSCEQPVLPDAAYWVARPPRDHIEKGNRHGGDRA